MADVRVAAAAIEVRSVVYWAFFASSVPTTTEVKSGRESITFEKVYEVCTWKCCEKRLVSWTKPP